MDVVERLSLEAASRQTLMAVEHRHRYELATKLCHGGRVLDLCCGTGYGASLLRREASSVHGVDISESAIGAAQTAFREESALTFERDDAVKYLSQLEPSEFDAIVCFEGLEHVDGLDRALRELLRLARAGTSLILSVPNSRTFSEENPFHLTDFGYEEMLEAFAAFPACRILYQWIAEGSVIGCPSADELEVELIIEDRAEAEYANHFLALVNVPGDRFGVVDGRLLVSSAPLHNRWLRGIVTANEELWRTNARLAREQAGRFEAAAGKVLETHKREVDELEQTVAGLRRRLNEVSGELEWWQEEARKNWRLWDREQFRVATVSNERDRAMEERDVALRRLEALRRRKVVRVALRVAALRRLRR